MLLISLESEYVEMGGGLFHVNEPKKTTGRNPRARSGVNSLIDNNCLPKIKYEVEQ
jgi:hypothetical protein